MTAPSASSQDTPFQIMPFSSDAFDEALRRAEAALGRGQGTSFVLAGASSEQCKDVLGLVAERTSLNVHQFKLPNLIGERHIETQANLREVFDKAGENAALLYFAKADALFTSTEHGGPPKEDEYTPARYLFERVEAFKGIVLVCLNDAAHIREAQERGVQTIVTFE